MSAMKSGIASLALKKSAAISILAAEAMIFFIIVVRYKIEPLIILSSLLPKEKKPLARLFEPGAVKYDALLLTNRIILLAL